MTGTANRTDTTQQTYREARIAHWDSVARLTDKWKGWGGYYHKRLAQIYQFLVPPHHRVIEIGCAQGELLAVLHPLVGVGVDFSSEMIQRGTRKHPNLRFIQADIHDLTLDERFDFIVISDLVNDLWDVQTAFQKIRQLATSRTRIILNLYSRLWEPLFGLAEKLKLAKPKLNQNWLTVEDISNLLDLADFEVIRVWQEVLWPLRTPLFDTLCNRFLVKALPGRYFAFTNFVVARPKPSREELCESPSVSVIVPARNEAGNIAAIFERTPQMGRETEIIFVEGHSKDDTYAAIETAMSEHPERACRLFKQEGSGKGDAVRQGFSRAGGDILMIVDADLTVRPEDLPRFYEVLTSHKAEFVNGVRNVYPMEKQAMRFWNLIGNKFFSLAFSWLLGQSVKDTLCGTKVLWKSDYARIAANRSYFGDFDPFGDFDLLFGAAKLNLKIVDLPVRYMERTYGTTNIRRWKHGWLLLKMVVFAAGRVKFV